jgi:hypothetical protein
MKIGIVHEHQLQLTHSIPSSHVWYHLVNTTSNTASAIVRARESLLVARLLVGSGGFGGASGSLVEDVGLVDGVLVVGLCGVC